MRTFSSLALLALTAGVLHARRIDPNALCCGWKSEPITNLDAMAESMDLVFYLQEKNGDLLKAEALAVSDPSSPRYGDYLTSEQVYALTQPSQESLDAVTSWLSAHGISHTVAHARRVHASMPLSVAADLFETEFSVLSHAKSNTNVTRAGPYTLPASVDAATAAIFGLHGLPLPPKTPIAPPPPPKVALVTPEVLAKTYNISGAPTPRGSATNHQAVAEFQGATMDSKDLAKFFKTYVKNFKAGDDKVAKFMGDKNDPTGVDEASLDIQYIMGNNPGIKTEFWLYNADDFCKCLAQWTAMVLETKDVPLVHSVSYSMEGSTSALENNNCAGAKQKLIDDNLAKMAAMGLTIIFSSGDFGSGYNPPQPGDQCPGLEKGKKLSGTVLKKIKDIYDAGDCCDEAKARTAAKGWAFHDENGNPNACVLYKTVNGTTEDKKYHSGRVKNHIELFSTWPSSSPWVTAVGATRFVGQTVGNEEMATDLFYSGGGFSELYNRSEAKWQDAVVKEYLANAPVLPPHGRYPPGGRAIPDVSALGEGYQIFNGGELQTIGGTSASAPMFAGLVSLLNEARQQKGGKAMGFLNPFLYQHPEAFTDITLGSNYDGDSSDLKYGFNCTKGWDPVTGLGTPIFPKMLAAAMGAMK